MTREVLFVAGMGDTAQQVPVFRQLAGLVTAPQFGVNYIDGVRQDGAQAVALTPAEQADAIAAKVDEVNGRKPGSDFRLVTYGLGALPTVRFLATERPDLDARAVLISPWDVSNGRVDADMVAHNSTHEKASIIMVHLEQLGAFSREFATGLEELSDEGSLKVICTAGDSIAGTVAPKDLVRVTSHPAMADGLDRLDVKKLLQAVLY